MILDRLFQFTANAGDAMPNATTSASTNIVDIGLTGIPTSGSGGGARDLGIGDDPALKILCEVTVAPTAGTSITVSVQGAPDNGSGAPGSFTTYATGPTVTQANAVLGVHLLDIDLPRPAPGVAYPRYLQLSYTTVGNMSSGTMQAWAVLDRWDQVISSAGVPSGYVPGITVAN